MKPHFFRSALAAVLLAFAAASTAEDIDLFVGATPSVSTELPNVLIVIDNTANWNTAFTAEMTALASAVSGLAADKFRLGFMMYTETGGGNSGNDGGYVRAAVRTLTGPNKTLYQNLVNSATGFTVGGDRTNNGKLGLVMSEVNRYFSGLAPHAGNNKNKTDYTGNATGTAASNAIYALSGNALGSKAGTPYNSPVSSGCQKNFVIFLSNGKSNSNNADNTTATTHLTSAGGNTTAIPLSPSGFQSEIADEWARYMASKSTNPIVSYVIDVIPTVAGQYNNDYKALLKSMAAQGKGKYFDVGSAGAADVGSKIQAALNQIFSEIQSVNSVFASVSLPVSVNTQGTYLNQVYIGMFRPDGNALPRWSGNLKQYKMGLVNNVLKLLDADETSAISASGSGFIAECARSFWTPDTGDTYWANLSVANCIGYAASSNFPDGNVVEKGAQGYKLRGVTPSARTVKTCSPVFALCPGLTGLTDFATTNTDITQTLLNSELLATDRNKLINWARGLNNKTVEDLIVIPNDTADTADNFNLTAAPATAMRPSTHGDVAHSRPVAINFGTDISPQVVVFYGGNDGVLRAVNGNRSTAIGSVAAGDELWSFIAPEFYGSIKRLRDNTVPIKFKGSTTVGAQPKPYGFDGTVAAFQGTIGATAKTFIYATMRRGGRVVYAFDVTAPASPVLKWKKGCPNNFPASGTVDDTDCTTGFTGMAQSWSAPKILKAEGYGSAPDTTRAPLLMMGGGYDTCEDYDAGTAGGANHNCSSTKGNRIYLMDADTGVLQQTFNTDRAVVGDVTIIPDSTTGLIKYAYASDMGGNVYRISGATANSPIGTTAPGSWTMTKIASLGCDTTATCTAPRKFTYGPDVVEESGTYYLLLGSGDREKPLTAYVSAKAVANNFFMIKDKPTEVTWLSSEASNCEGNSVICSASLTAITDNTTPVQATLDASKGWYLGLAASEQVVTSAITIFGKVTFSTHQPAVPVVGACGSNLGTSRVYNIGYLNAGSLNGTSNRYQDLGGDGLPPSPVAGLVTLDDETDDGIDNGLTVPFVIGANPDSPLETTLPSGGGGGAAVNTPKSRVYWYIQQ